MMHLLTETAVGCRTSAPEWQGPPEPHRHLQTGKEFVRWRPASAQCLRATQARLLWVLPPGERAPSILRLCTPYRVRTTSQILFRALETNLSFSCCPLNQLAHPG